MCIELLVFPMLADLWYGCIKCDDPFSVLVNYFSFSFKYSPLVSCLYVSAVLTHVVLFLFSPAMCFCLFTFCHVLFSCCPPFGHYLHHCIHLCLTVSPPIVCLPVNWLCIYVLCFCPFSARSCQFVF